MTRRRLHVRDGVRESAIPVKRATPQVLPGRSSPAICVAAYAEVGGFRAPATSKRRTIPYALTLSFPFFTTIQAFNRMRDMVLADWLPHDQQETLQRWFIDIDPSGLSWAGKVNNSHNWVKVFQAHSCLAGYGDVMCGAFGVGMVFYILPDQDLLAHEDVLSVRSREELERTHVHVLAASEMREHQNSYSSGVMS